ncbi:TIGR03087 family PEP-CTERM/XrtA system glycosyltransferase [Novosphingobium sp. 1949]|uniref:TIGR03087 family PEP-CTERM/XrtA system glycosyltransferase n=1 Tax=Novosphingobium organovorum TaxID=2930092 RepID=A0ABT0B9E5_9SPHN|nr:TIGR03087 family PEP-CTERM/XrtA system glycosyltransferase [Novosphingobium organovorum]MCJ2181667.1 TIGR03087 family PEP-CTERM/XrtA system glycosyltransferase [Novosphingobium organovorum]
MGDILFLAHRLPFPPDRGDKIRSHHVLRALAGRARVHVATFADDAADWAHEGELARLAESHCLVARRKPLACAAGEALLRRRPVSLCAFHDARIAGYVARVLARHPVSAIYIFSGQMAQYVPKDFQGRVVADLVDVDSAKFEAYAKAGHGPRAWLEAREARLLAAEEARIAARADATLLVSEAEAELLRARLPQPLASVHAMGNGIDAETFRPGAVMADPGMAEAGFPRLVFTGQMDYAPNVEAVLRAAHAVLPAVRAVFPEASLHIVGRNPTREVEALGAIGGVTVWGRVADVRPFLAAADMALVPLSIARGVQNKVLEAMAMGLPVVLSRGAATGIAASDGRHWRIAGSDAALAEAVIALASAPAQARAMGDAARQWIVANASWSAALAGLGSWCGLGEDDRRAEERVYGG